VNGALGGVGGDGVVGVDDAAGLLVRDVLAPVGNALVDAVHDRTALTALPVSAARRRET